MLTGITIQDAGGPLTVGNIGTWAGGEPFKVDLLVSYTLELDNVRIGFCLSNDMEHWFELRGHEGLVSRAQAIRERTGALRSFAPASSPYIWLHPI